MRKHSEETKKKISITNIKKNNPVMDIPFGKTKEQQRKYYARWRELNRDDYNKKRKAWADKYRKRRRKQARNSHLKIKFGITEDEYLDILKKQKNKCAICGKTYKINIDKLGRKTPNLYIDHCHTTNKIRGLLCRDCNLAIGHFKDSIKSINNSIKYLKKYDK